jgi:hypothetical protein
MSRKNRILVTDATGIVGYINPECIGPNEGDLPRLPARVRRDPSDLSLPDAGGGGGRAPAGLARERRPAASDDCGGR